MQNSNERFFSDKRGNLKALFVIVAVLCLFAVISAVTIIKNDKNYNTSTVEGAAFEERTVGKRKLTDACEDAAAGDAYVKIGGKPIGISINAGGLIVLGKSEVTTEIGAVYPAKDAKVERGDIVREINGKEVKSIYQLKLLLDESKGAVTLTVDRAGEIFKADITPATDIISGQKRIGLTLKEDIGGVGTLTFVTQDGRFGALGHYIADSESGLSSQLDNGYIYDTTVTGVVKGERGAAGGLIADVNRLSDPIGGIDKNTNIGIYGDYFSKYDGELYKIANVGEAKIGPAKVYTTISGNQPKFYDIDIVKVVSQSEAGEKGMVIAVRDKELLEKTGGIVQGMSGSPIVQNGILIGAVTHVFIQDPTRGYAVHSRFMYDYATSEQASELLSDGKTDAIVYSVA